MIVLVLELFLEKEDIHAAVQGRDQAHHQDLGHMRQLGDDRRRDQDEHSKAAEVGGEEACVCGQDEGHIKGLGIRLVVSRVLGQAHCRRHVLRVCVGDTKGNDRNG